MKNIYEYMIRYRFRYFSEYAGIPFYDISCLRHWDIVNIFYGIDSKFPCIVYDYGLTKYNSNNMITYRICYKNRVGGIMYGDEIYDLDVVINKFRERFQ